MDMDMDESEFKETLTLGLDHQSRKPYKQELERFRSVMIVGLDVDHIQSKDERATKEQNILRELI